MNIQIIKENIGYSATITDLGIFTQGDNFEELIANLKEAIELYYEDNSQFNNKINFNEFKNFNLVI